MKRRERGEGGREEEGDMKRREIGEGGREEEE